jgi:putative membrane protein
MTVQDLPALNASLNAISAVLLTIGWYFIHGGRVLPHKRAMIAACVTSTLFLASYVTYHAQVGSKPFTGTGILRIVYFSILIPHVLLAIFVLPLAIVTLLRGLRRDDARHRRIAKITLPLWWFVSVTGVIVYFMLYGIRT